MMRMYSGLQDQARKYAESKRAVVGLPEVTNPIRVSR